MDELITDIDDLRHLAPDEAEGVLARMREEALAAGGFLICQEVGEEEMLSEPARFAWLEGGGLLGLAIGEHERYLFPLRPVAGGELAPLENPVASQEGFLSLRALNREAFEPVRASLDLSAPNHGRLRLREARFHFASCDWAAALAAAEWV